MAAACNHLFWIDILKKEQRVKDKWEKLHGLQPQDKPVHLHKMVKTPGVTKNAYGKDVADHSKPHKETEVCIIIKKSKQSSTVDRCQKCKGAVTTFCYECCMCGCKRSKDLEHMKKCEDGEGEGSSRSPVKACKQCSQSSKCSSCQTQEKVSECSCSSRKKSSKSKIDKRKNRNK